ncbi:MAG: hypothetical protein OXL96_22080 [Candidatus Poribacteria bacterium]|nr:hypothetical protein [Candidatus Poribacteria bacterium]
MIHTLFRKHIVLTLILTLFAGTTLIALHTFACPITDWTWMDNDGNILGGYSSDCRNTERSAYVYASAYKGVDYKWGIIPYLYVSTSASVSGIDNDAKTGSWSLDAYVSGDPDPRYKSDTFRGSFSKSHDAYNKWYFASPSESPSNEADASVSHDQDSDVSTSSLSAP